MATFGTTGVLQLQGKTVTGSNQKKNTKHKSFKSIFFQVYFSTASFFHNLRSHRILAIFCCLQHCVICQLCRLQLAHAGLCVLQYSHMLVGMYGISGCIHFQPDIWPLSLSGSGSFQSRSRMKKSDNFTYLLFH